MLETIVLRAGIQGEHAKPIGKKVVAKAIFEKRVVGGFVSQSGQLMLARADEDDGENGDGDIPPPTPSLGILKMVKPKCAPQDKGEEKIDADEIINVGEVIGLPQFLKFFLDVRVLNRLDRWG